MLCFEELETAEELSWFSDFVEGVGIGLAVGGGIATIIYVGVAVAGTPT